jgi:lysyl-tRNA synthetase class 2
MNDVSQPIEKIILNRKNKLKKLEALSIDAYPNKFDYTHKTCEVSRDFSKLNPGYKSEENISVCGRLISRREMGKSTFGHIFDSTGKLQIYLRQNAGEENSFKTFIDMVDIGDFIGVEGTPFKTRTGELTVNAVRWCLLSKSLRPLPEKWHGLQDVETRYRQRYLDLIANENTRKIFYTRAKIITLIRQFLDKSNFLELETPIVQSMPP